MGMVWILFRIQSLSLSGLKFKLGKPRFRTHLISKSLSTPKRKLGVNNFVR